MFPLISKLLKEQFFIDEINKLKHKNEILCFATYFLKRFISDYEEYLNEDDGWQIFGDSFGNLDIYEKGKLVKSLYHDKNKNYIEPSDFIVKLIDFAELNYKNK
jgi:hypothetical protein